MRITRWIVLSLICGLMMNPGSDSFSFPHRTNSEKELDTHLRRPVAIVSSSDRILVGNRESGTISVIAPTEQKVVAEFCVAGRIADLTPVPLSGALFVLDDQRNQLLKVTPGTARDILAKVPASAVQLAVSENSHRVYINSKWPRQLTAIDFDDHFTQVRRTRTITLPFASHQMLLLDHDRTLLVAAAFGGQIAVLDAKTLQLRGIRKIAGHNIRGLAVSSDGSNLLVAHQSLDPARISDYEEVHWGRLVTNAVQVFGLRSFIDDEFAGDDSDAPTTGWLDTFGGIGGASADPGALVTGQNGVMAVCLAGTNEVGIRARGTVRRIPVGRRPSALAIHDGRIHVANQLDDTVSVVEIETGKVVQSLSLGPTPALSATQRGEQLFFDARLSHDGWLSCHSCHTDGHAAELLVDTLADGDYGAPKRIPSLLGTDKTGPWGWNGSQLSLDDQIQKSVETTMHGRRLSQTQVSDLAAYLRSLSAPPPPRRQSPNLIQRGRELFKSHGCVACHAPPHFTTAKTYDVGVADEKGRRQFNPPSLRGVSQRGRLLHDGRAANLEDLLKRLRHQLEEPLSEQERKALLAYLRSL